MNASITQISICLVAALTLFSIWQRGFTTTLPQTRRLLHDEGVAWMAGACLLWCVTGTLELVNTEQAKQYRTLFSFANSVFFLLAAINLDVYANSTEQYWFIRILRDRRKSFLIWLPIMLLGGTVVWLSLTDKNTDRYWKIPDVLFSVVIIVLLMHGFYKSFYKREFFILAYLSIFIFSVLIASQIPELSEVKALHHVLDGWPSVKAGLKLIVTFASELRVASKGMISLLFVALAYSWAHQKSEANNVVEFPGPEQSYLYDKKDLLK